MSRRAAYKSSNNPAARLVATMLVLLCMAAVADDAGLTDAEARGKRIYTKGETISGRVITAEIQLSAPPASASILPCIQCHGAGGEGIGDVAPGVRWNLLTEADGHQHLSRRHGPFNATTLAHVIREGVDPDGNKLEATMPRYRMTDADMADLIAYLGRVGMEYDPGLTSDAIRVGTVLPVEGPLASVGNAIRRVIEAQFSDLNAAGGIHGRRLELVVAGYGAESTPAFWAARDLVSRDKPFAMLASFLPGYEQELSELAETEQVPHIGPYTLRTNADAGHFEFFTQASIAEQALALVESTGVNGSRPRVAIVFPDVVGFDRIAESAAARPGWEGRVHAERFAVNAMPTESIIARLVSSGVEAVVFLGSGNELLEFARAADGRDWRPLLLAPARFAERVVFELPTGFDGRTYLAYPSLPDDYTEAGVIEFELLHQRHGIDFSESLAQVAAFTATRVLVEALDRAGPEPSRGALIAALESLDDFSPGLTPAITFGADRHIGSLGAHVLRVDLAAGRLDAEKRWISLAPESR
ncbi:MAG TPA: ABC transporter substrate-binding protein [Woeseiaceae bacterium]